jgi:D-psicose/D-tagatose/L-ribulose 3-epimerase
VNQLGANTWIWTSPPTDGWLAVNVPRLKEMGFDLVELPVENPGDWAPGRTAELLQEHGLGAAVCAVMPPGRDLSTEDPEVVESTSAYLRYCVDTAAILGARTVGGPIYAPVGRKWRIDADGRRKLYTQLAGRLEPLADYAGERGVRLALEPINRFETSVINTVDQALEVVEAVDSPALGLLLDTFHMNIEEKHPAEAVRTADDKLFHFHACGTDRGAPGEDHTDWDSIADALEEIGYDGPVCVESFTAENETIATAAAIWRPLAPSQDDIATRGLSFLRGLLLKT